MTVCRQCRLAVPDGALVCPYCGGKTTGGNIGLLVIVGVAAVVVVLASLFLGRSAGR